MFQVLAVTEQRMGYKGAVRVFEINREGGAREWQLGTCRTIDIRAILLTPMAYISCRNRRAIVCHPIVRVQGNSCSMDSARPIHRDRARERHSQLVGHGQSTFSASMARVRVRIRGPTRLSPQDGELFFDKEERAHSDLITDMQMSPDGTYFITSSKDKTAKVCAMRGIELATVLTVITV